VRIATQGDPCNDSREWVCSVVGSLVGLLVSKSCHTKQKDGYSLATNDPNNNRINWIWLSKKIGLN
jgi:hypothetical protein